LFLLAVSDSVRFRPALVLLLFGAVLLRAAYLYLVVALFYWIVPLLYRREDAKEAGIWTMGAGFLMLLLPTWAVGYRGIQGFLVTVTPYTFGNFSNYNHWFHTVSFTGWGVGGDVSEVLYHAGLGSILAYVQEYSGLRLAATPGAEPFLRQLSGVPRYGNVSSIYGSLVRLPLWIGLMLPFALGAMSEWVYRRAFGSTFFQSIYAWMAAAAFLSFAGAGFFTTTRFFPAVLYVWPALVAAHLMRRVRLKRTWP
jgi:hypothetical protein